MNRTEKRILLGLGALIVLLVVLEAMAPKPLDWRPSYSRYHATPYGGKLVHERLPDLFPEVRTTHEPIYQQAQLGDEQDGMGHGPVNHIYINEQFAPDELNSRELLRMAALGDHVFIATGSLEGPLADTLNVQMTWGGGWMRDDTVEVRFSGKERIAQGTFRFSRGFTRTHFIRYDTARTRVLAVDGAARPVLIDMTWGKGRIVLSSTPRAFSNYNLLKDDNARYMAGAFSVLPCQPVIWDEFHKVGRMESTSIMRFILREDPLKWAWRLAFALAMLYLIIHARRRQRAIPVIAPPRNDSRDLAHTIGRLYWHMGDHTDLARKMIGQFKEEVRVRTHLRHFGHDAATAAHLASKTGLPVENITARMAALQRREQAARITETDLLRLSDELHELRQLIR